MKQPFSFFSIISLYFNTFLKRLFNFCIPLKKYSEFLSLKWTKTVEMTSSSLVNFFHANPTSILKTKSNHLGLGRGCRVGDLILGNHSTK
jgi:hypothetical protein